MSELQNSSLKPFRKGIIDGLPVCFGYFSVAFAFGIFSLSNGLSVLEALLISLSNVTSAGQLAAVPIICTQGTLIELALTEFVINLRYSLMSIILAQKLDEKVSLLDKFVIAFVNTDEVFAISVAQKGKLCKEYMFGLILTPYFGWALGTLMGALAGDLLPPIVSDALGVAIYGMFVAIVVPNVKSEKALLYCVMMAIVFSCFIHYCLPMIPSGFAIIISALSASIIMSFIRPYREAENE